MPSDILGTHILRETAGGGREMTFQSGPVFTNILLADEINRASPKTQSALLEAMQERSVTLLGNTRPLPDPFFVLASQNPIELEGTYPLPEAQLDRFLFKLTVSDVSVDVLDDIISTRGAGEPPVPASPLSVGELSRLFAVMERMYLPRAVSRYISRLVAASHPGSPEATTDVSAYVTYRRQSAGGNRHGGGRPGLCLVERQAQCRVRGRAGRGRGRHEPPADPQLQGAFRPVERVCDHSRSVEIARRGRSGRGKGTGHVFGHGFIWKIRLLAEKWTSPHQSRIMRFCLALGFFFSFRPRRGPTRRWAMSRSPCSRCRAKKVCPVGSYGSVSGTVHGYVELRVQLKNSSAKSNSCICVIPEMNATAASTTA